jgi:hypothetical protein
MHRRPVGIALRLVVLAVLVGALLPASAVACSCVGPEFLLADLGVDDPKNPDPAVFTGTVGPALASGVPVSITSWFSGPAPAPVVTIDVDQMDESSCGTDPPPAGRQFLFVAWEADELRYGMNLCTVVADLGTDEGQAMLATVVDRLGAPIPIGAAPPGSGDGDGLLADLVPMGLGLLAAFAVVAGLFVWISRRDDA